MTRHVVSNHMVAHLWANQSQDHAHNTHNSVSFNGRFYRSYHTVVARITDAHLREAQVVLVCDNGWGVTTGRHINNALSALHGHARYHIMRVTMVQSRSWGEADDIPHTINIKSMYEEYEKRCERICKPHAYFYGYYDQPDGEESGDTLNNRLRAIYAAARPYREYCMAFQYEEPYPNFDYWTYRLRQAWARYYDPAQSDKRASMEARSRQRAFSSLAWAYAYIEGVAPKSAVFLRHVPRRLRRDIEWRIRSYENPYRENPERITPKQWMDGKGSSWFTDYTDMGLRHTMLRRKGNSLETSRGAVVPWAEAYVAFQAAQRVRCRGVEYKRNGLAMVGGRVGGFVVDRIEANGDLHIGCHHLAYDEMQRLAIREAPEAVRACYPVPAPYAGDYRGLPFDPPSLAHILVARPKGFKCGDDYCSYCGDKYDPEIDICE